MADKTAEQILAEQSKEWQESESNSSWYPPEDGTYTASISSVEAETRGKGDRARAGISVVHRLEDGQYEGKTHPGGFFHAKNFFLLKSYIEALGTDPEEFGSPIEALDFLKSKVGTVVQEEIETRPYVDRNGKDRTSREVRVIQAIG